MDRDDADNEAGRTLPITDWYRMVAREEANQAIVQHLKLCPLNAQDLQGRIRGVELTLSRLIGFMIGSGLIGGVTSGLITNLLHR
jgi:hypothetical protein